MRVSSIAGVNRVWFPGSLLPCVKIGVLQMSLLAPDDSFGIAGLLFAIVLLALWAERTGAGKTLSASLISIAGGLIAANAGILPHEAPAYGFVLQYLVPLAIPLLLLKADLRRIITETGPTLIAFSAGVAGTVLGASLGYAITDVGPETGKIVSVLAASFIGGSVNFVAVSQILQLEDASLVSAAVAAQGVAAIVFLSLLVVAPRLGLLQRLLPSRRLSSYEVSPAAERGRDTPPIFMLDIAATLSIGLLICAVGVGIANALGITHLALLFITALAVTLATMLPSRLRRLRGDTEVAMLLIYVFFAVMGARSDLGLLAGTALALLLFLVVLLLTHSIFVLVIAKIFRLDLAEALIGSNACALGPPTAAAAAAGQKWHGLVTPGILCGILGYVVANFIGAGMAYLLSG